jgi:hypothetical protein
VQYGILKSAVNTGLDSELQCVFSAPLTIISNQPAYVQDMMSLKRRAASQGVQRWEITAGIAASNDSPNFLVHSIANGYETPFYIRMPQVAGLKLTNATNTVLGNTVFGNTIIDITGLGITTGEFIQFQGHSKVYNVIEGGNSLFIRIKPALEITVANGTPIISGGKVTLTARYDQATKLGMTYVDGMLSDQGSVTFIEAL